MTLKQAKEVRDRNLNLIGSFYKKENDVIRDVLVVPHRNLTKFLKTYCNDLTRRPNDEMLQKFRSRNYSVVLIFETRYLSDTMFKNCYLEEQLAVA